MSKHMSSAQQISLPEDIRVQAQERANSLGLTLTEYVQTLVESDVHSLSDPWHQPLPWEVEKQYLLDEIEFYDQEKTRPQKEAHSAEELVRLLSEDIQQLDRDETD